MDFRELSYVVAIAKYQNITKAAESLYIGQPTLSKFLMSLESELGLKLFRRLGNKYTLTYAGERYLERANQILGVKNDLDAEMADIIKRDVGVLNVAFANMRCSYMLPDTLPTFQKHHPNVRVNIYEGNSSQNDRLILSGDIDVAFSSKPNELNPLIEYQSLGKEELVICTCENHALGRFAHPNPASKYPRLDVSLLKNEKVLMMQPDQRTRQIVDKFLKDREIRFENVLYTSNLQAIMELVAIGYGVSFIFESHLRHRADTKPIECYSFGEPKVVNDFVAAYRKGSYLSSYAHEYVEVVRQSFLKGETRQLT